MTTDPTDWRTHAALALQVNSLARQWVDPAHTEAFHAAVEKAFAQKALIQPEAGGEVTP